MKPSEIKKIRLWLLRVEKSRNGFDDIHIDEICKSSHKKNSWAKDGMECLDTAIAIRDELQIQLSVALAFSLQGDSSPKNLSFSSIKNLLDECDITPPSLYLFDFRDAMWRDTPKRKVSWSKIKIGKPFFERYYIEYLDKNDSDFRRSFWVVSRI